MRIIVDIDDVTAQFRQRAVDLVNVLFYKNLRYEDCLGFYEVQKSFGLTEEQEKEFWHHVCRPGFAQTLELMPDAKEVIFSIAKKHQVVFASAPMERANRDARTWYYDRCLWIEEHFGHQYATSFHYTRSKHEIDGDVLIEDKPSTLENWMDERARRCGNHRKHTAIAYAWPYNESLGKSPYPVSRCYGWRAIHGHIMGEPLP